MQGVYIEAVLADNFLLDYAALYCAGRLSRRRIHPWLTAAGAAIGAVYSAAALMPGLEWLSGAAAKTAAAAVMCAVSFECEGWKKLLMSLLCLFFSTFLMGGAALAAGCVRLSGGAVIMQSFPVRAVLIGTAAAVMLIRAMRQRRMHAAEICDMEAEINGKSIKIKALVDTGCSACDPISGLPAAIIDAGLMDESADPWDIPGVRAVPVHTVAGDAVLPAFLPERLYINGEACRDMLIALRKNAKGSGYRALIPAAALAETRGIKNAQDEKTVC